MTTDALETLALAVEEAAGLRLDRLAGAGYWSVDGTIRHAASLRRIEAALVPQDGQAVLSRVFVAFPDGSLLRPDLAVYARPPQEDDTAVTLVPEAICEIVSEESRFRDTEIVPSFCLEWGVKDVIVFDPFSLLTIHHRRDRPPVRYSETTEIRLECGCLVTV